ncbi:hypothetical protein [Tenacibaculum aiptasiae]|uniref:hypothetical protein n=1 Tax=Tenacibaculum aiptasiae TaxID=426481 RepID=UPI00232DEB03|nr:hypothetical protein [Tenacibaculum aiptasiae]
MPIKNDINLIIGENYYYNFGDGKGPRKGRLSKIYNWFDKENNIASISLDIYNGNQIVDGHKIYSDEIRYTRKEAMKKTVIH